MSGSSAPPPVPQAPNYGPVLQATQAQIDFQRDTSQQQMDWAKQQYADNLPYSNQVRSKLMSTLDENTENARRDRARYENVYQPLEDQIVGEAKSFDTPERRMQARGRAEAGVAQSFDAAGAAATRELERYGADPTSVRYGALDLGSKLARATAGAAASETADNQVQQTGINYRLQAANMGKGLPAQAIAGYQTGTGAGTAGVGAGNSTTAGASGALGNPMGWNAGVNQSIGTWGNLLGQQYSNQMQGWNASAQAANMQNNSSSGVGSALGALAGGAMMFLEEGGEVPGVDTGRGAYLDPSLSPSDGAETDDIEATGPGGSAVNLNAHEFVMPADVVMFRGKQWMQKQVEKARTEMGDPDAGRTAKPAVKALPHPRGVPLPTQTNMAGGGMVRSAPFGSPVPRGVNLQKMGGPMKPPTLHKATPWFMKQQPGSDTTGMKSAVPTKSFR